MLFRSLKEFNTEHDVTVFTTEGDESFKCDKGSGIYELQGDDEVDAEKKPSEPTKKPATPDKRAE